jgi:hypothetical protein
MANLSITSRKKFYPATNKPYLHLTRLNIGEEIENRAVKKHTPILEGCPRSRAEVG